MKKKTIRKSQYGLITSGTIYVIFILAIAMAIGFILTGGFPRTQDDKPYYTPVNIITSTPGPTHSNLQMNTFTGVTLTPKPVAP